MAHFFKSSDSNRFHYVWIDTTWHLFRQNLCASQQACYSFNIWFWTAHHFVVNFSSKQKILGQRMKKTLSFIISLLVLMGVGLVFHLQFNPLAQTFLIQSYGINAVLTLVALTLLAWGIDKKKSNLAVLYLLTVALKFSTYFILFHPKFHLDGILIRQEFFIFFIPYSLGLILEIMLLARRYKQ